MSHYRKEDPTPFDDLSVPGLNFTISEFLLPGFENLPYTEYKFPCIEFPSGEGFSVSEGENSELLVNVFGKMKLQYFLSRDEAFEVAARIAETTGYGISKVGENELEVIGHDTFEHYQITFDNERHQIVDIVYVGAEG